uniref:Dynamin-binding protein n=1 Tax=Acanthochromis polyacanthus TaxID=80966 RepID=A0A3Q1FAM3_9TELE
MTPHDLSTPPSPALDPEEARLRKMNRRAKIIQELVQTEKDYLTDLELCIRESSLNSCFLLSFQVVDVDRLFTNMETVCEVSAALLHRLHAAIADPDPEAVVIGEVFIQAKAALEDVYKIYCYHHDDANGALKSYEKEEEIKQHFTTWKPNLLDMGSLIIKPVQRIMKYPLLLGELWHATPEDHPDHRPLQEAFTAAKIINVNINEFKRRKDIVMKYKRLEDEGTLRGKLNKFNIHSIRKKGDRFAGYLKILTGVEPQVRDEVFDREEKLFRSLEKAVRQLVKNVHCYLQYTQVISYFPTEKKQHLTNLHLLSFFSLQKDSMERLVLGPLSSLQGMFTAPQKLIQKRYDKLLDYCSRLERSSSFSSPSSTTSSSPSLVSEEPPGPARRDYEALNALLVEELQRFNVAAYAILTNSVVYLVDLLRGLMNNVLVGAPSIQQLPVRTPHINHIIRLSLNLQSKAWLLTEYPLKRLYQLKRKCNGCQEQDLSLLEGELVALLEDTDPLGSSSRWLVHTGGNCVAGSFLGTSDNKHFQSCLITFRLCLFPQFYAVYAFQARCEQELTLQEYQHVRILQFCDLGGNKEWWLAEANGQKGYVPANYLGRMSYA